MKCAEIRCRRETLPSSNFCLEHRPAPTPAPIEKKPFDFRYWSFIWGARLVIAAVLASLVVACGSTGVLAIVGAAYVLGHPL